MSQAVASTQFKRAGHGLRVLYQDLDRCDLFRQASAMAYTTLFSLIPSLAAVFTLVNLFAPFLGENTNLMNKARDFILQNLAAGSGEQVVVYLNQFIMQLDMKKIGITSFAGLIVTLVLLLKQIEEALNRIWLVRKTRNVVVRFIYFWTFLTLGVLVGGIALGFFYKFKLDQLVNYGASVTSSGTWYGGFISSLFAWLTTIGFFFLLYKIVPNCQVAAREAAIGATVAGTLFHQGGRLYGIYVANFTSYASVFGALAAVPIFLFWLYVCWLIILLGALVAWRVQQGFPKEKQEETLDSVRRPSEWLRNTHIKVVLPVLLLVLIYRNFSLATGRGISATELSRKLKIPMLWITDVLDALEDMQLIISTQSARGAPSDQVDARGNEFFPALPADKIHLGRIADGLTKPIRDWLPHWRHEFPIDLAAIVHQLACLDRERFKDITLAEVFGAETTKPR